jgi:hypothetical protein
MAKMNPMQSMELDDEDVLDMACPIPIDVKDRPRFPYGLKICLTDKEMAKMGLDTSEAVVGGLIHLHAMARITSVSTNETQDGDENFRMELQIEDMCVESEDEENAEEEAQEDAPRRRSPLYGT